MIGSYGFVGLEISSDSIRLHAVYRTPKPYSIWKVWVVSVEECLGDGV